MSSLRGRYAPLFGTLRVHWLRLKTVSAEFGDRCSSQLSYTPKRAASLMHDRDRQCKPGRRPVSRREMMSKPCNGNQSREESMRKIFVSAAIIAGVAMIAATAF